MTVEEIFSGETDKIEYKVDIPPKSENYMRTVVAYANANGGRLVFGVENNTWHVAGFDREEVFQKMDAITNAIYIHYAKRIFRMYRRGDRSCVRICFRAY